MEQNILVSVSTGVPFRDYHYFIKNSNLVMMECKTHVSKSQSAHNLLKVFINYKTSHLNILKKKLI